MNGDGSTTDINIILLWFVVNVGNLKYKDINDLLSRFYLNSFVIAELKIMNDGFQALIKENERLKISSKGIK